MKSDQRMSTVERRRFILEEIHHHKMVDVMPLSARFQVSEVTIRKDLRYLENKKLLIRSRGGAMAPVQVADDLSVEERKVLNYHEKKSIAAAASMLISDGDTIIIDSGTTLMQLAKYINRINNLTVITNSIDIAYQLSTFENIKLIIPGGLFRRKSRSLIGVAAVENMKMYQADKYFVCADGIGEEGIFTSNLEEGQIARLIISNAKENIVLIDSSKFDRKGLINFAPLSKIHTVVTDRKIPKHYLSHLSEQGINVIIAEK